MSTPTPTSTPTKADALWRVTIIAIFVIGIAVAVVLPLINGNLSSITVGCQVIGFGILIAAIRSLRH